MRRQQNVKETEGKRPAIIPYARVFVNIFLMHGPEGIDIVGLLQYAMQICLRW